MEKPIVLVIMDGVGKGDGGPGDAVKLAATPTLDHLWATCPHTYLKAHGTAVGLPSDEDMGNSEVGHNALGCGQIYSQGAKLVGESIENGTLYASETWKDLIANAVSGKALHFLGLLSDGNVHSNIHHLIAMLREAHAEGVKKAYCHILLDGRDVPATSALEYVDMLEKVLAELNTEGCDYAIASGGGRMQITMDRYEANWPMVEQGWRTHVQAIGRRFPSAKAAIETYRAETGCIDQDLPAFVIERSGEPVAKIANGDSVILFNFRGDRAQEISLAFDRKDFDHFDRGDYTGVKFAGMLQYDGDLKIPQHYLVQPPVIKHTLTEVLCAAGIHEYALSETQKYGHVTYFWNGNRSGKVDENLEVYEEVPSDVIPFEKAPAMKSKIRRAISLLVSSRFSRTMRLDWRWSQISLLVSYRSGFMNTTLFPPLPFRFITLPLSLRSFRENTGRGAGASYSGVPLVKKELFFSPVDAEDCPMGRISVSISVSSS